MYVQGFLFKVQRKIAIYDRRLCKGMEGKVQHKVRKGYGRGVYQKL